MKIFNFKSSNGFTLVELIIAIALFTLIASFSIGAVLSIFSANRKARSSKTVVDNLNFAIENMVRVARFGNNYHCGDIAPLSVSRDCPAGDNFLALNFEGNTLVYRLNGVAIQRSDNGGSTYTDITPSETVIENLKFYVLNSSSNNKQPYIIVVIKGYSGNRPTNQSKFSIQTLISQRVLNI